MQEFLVFLLKTVTTAQVKSHSHDETVFPVSRSTGCSGCAPHHHGVVWLRDTQHPSAELAHGWR